MQIEWQNSEEEKLKIAKAILAKFPTYAPAWKVIANKSDDHNERLAAIKKGLALNPDFETMGMLLINRALIFDVQRGYRSTVDDKRFTERAEQIENQRIIIHSLSIIYNVRRVAFKGIRKKQRKYWED